MKSNFCWSFVLLLFVVAVLEGCDAKTQHGAWVEKPAADIPMQTSKDPSAPPPLLPELPGDPVASKYTGSQWELTGFANSVTGEVRAPESIPGDVCYWLRLNTNRSYLLNTSGDILYGSYDADTLKQTMSFFPWAASRPAGMGGDERTADGQTLKEAFMQVDRFLESGTELKLFYGSNLYLLFERREALPRPSGMAGMRWRLTGLGNDKTRVPEAATKPENYRMYTLWLRTDGRIVGHSTSNDLYGFYRIDPPGVLHLQAGPMTDMGEREDEGYAFLDALKGSYTYSFEEDELRISCNDSLYLQLKTY